MTLNWVHTRNYKCKTYSLPFHRIKKKGKRKCAVSSLLSLNYILFTTAILSLWLYSLGAGFQSMQNISKNNCGGVSVWVFFRIWPKHVFPARYIQITGGREVKTYVWEISSLSDRNSLCHIPFPMRIKTALFLFCNLHHTERPENWYLSVKAAGDFKLSGIKLSHSQFSAV